MAWLCLWWHRTESTLVQVCLVTWRHQAITWTTVNFSSVRFSNIHLRTISQDIPEPSITEISLKITFVTCHPILPGTNELIKSNRIHLLPAQHCNCITVFHKQWLLIRPDPGSHNILFWVCFLDNSMYCLRWHEQGLSKWEKILHI